MKALPLGVMSTRIFFAMNIFSMNIGNEIIPITSIIPELRLKHATDDDILFQSNIKKLLNQKKIFVKVFGKKK